MSPKRRLFKGPLPLPAGAALAMAANGLRSGRVARVAFLWGKEFFSAPQSTFLRYDWGWRVDGTRPQVWVVYVDSHLRHFRGASAI